MRHERTLAVAVHDIEPATFERAALIRDWLDDLGVDRATLLVIPARDMHPLSDRRPEVATWLLERAGRGDAIAQHGFHHLQSRQPRWPPHPRHAAARESPEFVGLDGLATARALDAGRRILKLAGIEPRGFVAPAYPTRRSCASRCAPALPGGPAPGACTRPVRTRERTCSRHRSGWRPPDHCGEPSLPACCARRAAWRARPCGSTCTRWTSPRQVTCWRSRT